MQTFQHYVDQINQLLEELIKIANRLRDMSLQVISEEDLAPLQKKQEDLLIQLENADQEFQENYQHQLTAAVQDNIHKKLQTFQQLNQEFIQNLSNSHGLIQFDLHRIDDQEGQDFSRFNRLNKISSSPDGSKAVNSEEEKES